MICLAFAITFNSSARGNGCLVVSGDLHAFRIGSCQRFLALLQVLQSGSEIAFGCGLALLISGLVLLGLSQVLVVVCQLCLQRTLQQSELVLGLVLHLTKLSKLSLGLLLHVSQDINDTTALVLVVGCR